MNYKIRLAAGVIILMILGSFPLTSRAAYNDLSVSKIMGIKLNPSVSFPPRSELGAIGFDKNPIEDHNLITYTARSPLTNQGTILYYKLHYQNRDKSTTTHNGHATTWQFFVDASNSITFIVRIVENPTHEEELLWNLSHDPRSHAIIIIGVALPNVNMNKWASSYDMDGDLEFPIPK